MKKEEIKIYKERLLKLRRRLRGDVTSMADVALGSENSESSSMPIHMAELGSENFEQEFTLSLMASEEGTLSLIEGALVRIENGNYATCTECERKIPKTRLNAIPYAPLCFKCADSGENSTNGHRLIDHGSNGRSLDEKSGKGTGEKTRGSSPRRVNRPR